MADHPTHPDTARFAPDPDPPREDGSQNDEAFADARFDQDTAWGSEWWTDNDAETFVLKPGSGSDMIYDFQSDHDVIDLSAYGAQFDQLQNAITDRGWAAEIDLSSLTGGQEGDKLIIKSVDIDALEEKNFLL